MNLDQKRKVAVVTGASSGIGRSFCHVLAGENWDLVAVARRENLLLELQTEIEGNYPCKVHVVVADLANPDSPGKIKETTDSLGIQVDSIINNAGYGVSGAFASLSWEDHQKYIQVMCTSPTKLIHCYLPGMLERGYGKILNVASFSSYFVGSPYLTLYAALKHYVLVLSHSLYGETIGTGVTVTAMCPGGTKTDWFAKADSEDAVASLPQFTFLSSAEVAQRGYEAMMKGKLSVIPGFWAKFSVWASRLLPDAIILRMLARSFSKRH
jgi:uncharacterized protein